LENMRSKRTIEVGNLKDTATVELDFSSINPWAPERVESRIRVRCDIHECPYHREGSRKCWASSEAFYTSKCFARFGLIRLRFKDYYLGLVDVFMHSGATIPEPARVHKTWIKCKPLPRSLDSARNTIIKRYRDGRA
jgi:hypothetical protein